MNPELLYNGRPMSNLDTRGDSPSAVATRVVTTGHARIELEPGDGTRYLLHLIWEPESEGLTVLRYHAGWPRDPAILQLLDWYRAPTDFTPLSAGNTWTTHLLCWYLRQVLEEILHHAR